MNWKEIYKHYSKGRSERDIDIGIGDWEQRSSIFLKWLDEQKCKRDSKFLDCGCNIGICSKILKENGYENVIGIDVDDNVLNFAKSVCKIQKMNCEKMTFPVNSFDVVFALNVIEHLHKPEVFLKKVRKILKEGGLLILSVPNTTRLRRLFGRALIVPDHLNYWRYKSFAHFLEKNGFKTLDMKPIGRVPFLSQCQTFMVLCQPYEL